MTRRILAVDDQEFNRNHLRKILEADGFEVETVAEGRLGLGRAPGRKYHLVITDLRMPELSGLDLLARVRGERLPVGHDRADGLRRPHRGPAGHEGRRR